MLLAAPISIDNIARSSGTGRAKTNEGRSDCDLYIFQPPCFRGSRDSIVRTSLFAALLLSKSTIYSNSAFTGQCAPPYGLVAVAGKIPPNCAFQAAGLGGGGGGLTGAEGAAIEPFSAIHDFRKASGISTGLSPIDSMSSVTFPAATAVSR